MLQEPEALTVTEAKATDRDTVAKVFPKRRPAIGARGRTASRGEVALSVGHSLRPPCRPGRRGAGGH